MHITIFGSGNIGATLAKKWAAAGHTITFAVRDSNNPKYQQLLQTIPGEVDIATGLEVLKEAEVVLFAIPGQAVEEIVTQLGDRLRGKTIIDATNKIQAAEMNNLATIAAHVPDANLFRAFSSLGWENFENPQLHGQPIDLFYCGDNGSAQKTVEQLITDIGLHPVCIGNLEQASIIDNLTKLWFALAFQQGHGRRLAFKMVTE